MMTLALAWSTVKKFHRWIFAFLILAGLIVLWFFVSSNKALRERLEASMLQVVVANKIADLREKASQIQSQAQSDVMNADEAQKQAQQIQQQIDANKAVLQQGLAERGISAEEISARLNSLGE